jgi:hypothetical protein
MGLLLPSGDVSLKFTQLYIYDVRDEAVKKLSPFTRGNSTSDLDEGVVCGLIKMLDETHDLVKLFQGAKQRLANDRGPNYTLCLLGKRDNDSRQYDDPSSDNVSGLVVGDIGSFYFKRDIVVESCS